MPDVQRYLREGEIKAYENAIRLGHRVLIKTYENLSACRALLKKYHWIKHCSGLRYCLECGREECYGDTLDCAIAAQLAGVKRGE